MSEFDQSIDPNHSIDLLISLINRQSNQIANIEKKVEQLTEIISKLTEQIAVDRSVSPTDSNQSGTADFLMPFRKALSDRNWMQAKLIRARMAEHHPLEAEIAFFDAIYREAHAKFLDDTLGRLAMAKDAGDVPSTLAIRDELKTVVDAADFAAVDSQLIEWLMREIQRKLRKSSINGDLVDQIASIVDRFGATPQGASLQAALPTLRRSVGLCGRCGLPYRGLDAACPRCLNQPEKPESVEDDEFDRIITTSDPDQGIGKIWLLEDENETDPA